MARSHLLTASFGALLIGAALAGSVAAQPTLKTTTTPPPTVVTGSTTAPSNLSPISCLTQTSAPSYSAGQQQQPSCTLGGAMTVSDTALPTTSAAGAAQVVVGGGGPDGAAPSVYSTPIAGVGSDGFKHTAVTDLNGNLRADLLINGVLPSSTNRLYVIATGSHGGALSTDSSDRLVTVPYAALGSIPGDGNPSFSTITSVAGVQFLFNGTYYDRPRDVIGAAGTGTGTTAAALMPHAVVTNGLSYSTNFAPTSAGYNVKSTGGNVYGYTIENGATAGVYVAFIDVSAATPTIAATNLRACVGPLAAGAGVTFARDIPISFGSGISYVATTTPCNATATAPPNQPVNIMVEYK